MKKKSINKELCEYLATCRKKKNLTLTVVAKSIGMDSVQYLSNIERGTCNASPEVIKAYIEHCGASINKIASLYSKFFIAKINAA